MKKESQQSRNRWWFWSRDAAKRTPDVLTSTASESPVKTRYESQMPLSSGTEQHQRTGRPVEDAYSSSFSEWNVDKTWSSQGWKSDELMEDRTGWPVLFAQHTDSFIVDDDDVDSNTIAESDMSLNPDHSCTGWMIDFERFWTNPQKMQHKTATNILWYGECLCLQHCKHMYSRGRITQTICIPSKIHKISQWNRCSTCLRNW